MRYVQTWPTYKTRQRHGKLASKDHPMPWEAWAILLAILGLFVRF